jgi:hypothetical protein
LPSEASRIAAQLNGPLNGDLPVTVAHVEGTVLAEATEISVRGTT